MDIIMRKVYNFLEFFIPFFWMVGGFILIVKGIEIIEELNGVSYYIVSIALLFMTFGICGKYFKDLGMDEEIEKDKKKRKKRENKNE